MRGSSKYSGCSDNDSGLSLGKEFSSSFSSSHSITRNSARSKFKDQTVYMKIVIIDLLKEVKYEFSAAHSVFDVKRVIVKKYGPRLVDSINYGLFIPHNNDKCGKFLQEERLLIEYFSGKTNVNLEFIYKCRIVWPIKANDELNKKINSKVNQNRFIDYIIRNDPSKIKKAVDKGLDPNFHCSSGETPLTLTTKLSKPIDVITALVSGGAHLDYRALDSLTPLHKAAISGNYDCVVTLLNFGASANYLDSEGMTPAYYNLLYDNSTKCLEKLLYEHAKLGVSDKKGLKEIHQACRSGKMDHLDILLAYGADINSRTENHNSTPLHVAAYCGQEDCVRLLLVRGADRNLVNSSNRTSAQEARATFYKAMATLIQDFKDSEIHKHSSFKATFNPRRNKSEFDITTAYSNMKGLVSEGSVTLCSADRSRKKVLHGKISEFDKERSLSHNAVGGCNVFSDNEDISAPLRLKSNTQSSKGKKRTKRLDNTWYHSSTLSLNNENLSENDLIRVVVLQKSSCCNYGIDLDQREEEQSYPCKHYIKNIEIGSPAFLAGIRSEDYLLEVNGTDIHHADINTVFKLINDKPDSVVLKIVRSNKYSDSSTDPSLHYEHFMYDGSRPLRSFSSVDNLNSLIIKPPNCESSTTLNSINTIISPRNENARRKNKSCKVRSSSSDKRNALETCTNFKMNSSKVGKSLTLGKSLSKSTEKKLQKQTLSNKDVILKYRSPITPVFGSNADPLKPILKNTSASCSVRENIAIVKSRLQSPSERRQNDVYKSHLQSLQNRQRQNRSTFQTNSDFQNKTTLPQSQSFDNGNLSRVCSLKQSSYTIRPTLGDKEPKVSETKSKDSNSVKVSTSEEDFCLPPPISFQ